MVQDTTNLLAPATGAVIALAKTSDPIFSQGTMGDGFGLTPTIGKVVAPVSGKISMVADTKHAVGIVTNEGLEVLVHMGVDTVGLKGAANNRLENSKAYELMKDKTVYFIGKLFTDFPKAGDEIAEMDLDEIKAKGLDTTIMVLITNSADKISGLDVTEGEAKAGEAVATAYLKTAEAEDTSSKKLSYPELASFIIKNVGGKENVNNVIHCITRLRFYLKDESKANDDVLKNHVVPIMNYQKSRIQDQGKQTPKVARPIHLGQ